MKLIIIKPLVDYFKPNHSVFAEYLVEQQPNYYIPKPYINKILTYRR